MLATAFLLVTTAASVLGDTYPVFLPADSLMLQYQPRHIYNDPPLPGAWNTTYTNAMWVDPTSHGYAGGNNANAAYWNTGRAGDDAPTMRYSFTGSGIKIWGYWGIPQTKYAPGTSSAGSVDLVVDGQTTSNSGGGPDAPINELVVLAETSGLDAEKQHDVTLYLRSGDVAVVSVEAELNFGNVPATAIAAGEAAALAQSNQDYERVNEDTSPSVIYTTKLAPDTTNMSLVANPAVQFTGTGWLINTMVQRLYYPVMQSRDDSATMQVNIGTGNCFLRINGSIGYDRDRIAVAVQPKPPYMPEAQTVLNGSSETWASYTTYYAAVLDPTVNYTVGLRNWPVRFIGAYLDVHAFELWKTDSGNATNAGNNPSGTTGTSGTNDTTGTKSDTSSNGSGNGSDSANGNASANGSDNASANASANGSANGSSNDTAKAKSSQVSNVGAIAGGVVGGVVALALVGLLAYCWGRRSRNNNNSGTDHGSREPDFAVEQHEFKPLPSRTTSRTHAPNVMATPYVGEKAGLVPSDYSMSPSSPNASSPVTTTLSSGFSSSGGGTSQRGRTTTGTGTHTRSSVASFEQEADAGALEPIDETAFRRPREIVPPSYNPTWAERRADGLHGPQGPASPPLSKGTGPSEAGHIIEARGWPRPPLPQPPVGGASSYGV